MEYYGGSGGFIHCGWKMLHRADGWFEPSGRHVKDDRLTWPRVDGIQKRTPNLQC